MKKIYFLLLISLMGTRFAYAQDTTSLAGKMQFVFAQLNRTAISTGYLEERAFPLVSLTPFNGILTDSNKVAINTLRATYFTHYSACMLNTNPMLPIDSVNNRINQYLPITDVIPIAIHFGEFNAFKSNAVSNNLLSIDGDEVLHDVPGRTENPYLLKSLFVASPLKSDFATGNFALVFKPNLFFTNSTLTVSTLYIDFDDGNGYQSVSWNMPIAPNYGTAGPKNIKLKMVLSNSNQYECYAPITVANIPAQFRYSITPPSPVPFYATNNHSGGNVFVRYSSTNNTGHLKKPLIVLEGYDASRIAPNLTDGNYTYSHFIEAINKPSATYDFNYQLDDIAGYDLVFIDYANGTDYIERNANLFKEVLIWVNTDKALSGSTQQNVVMGISMGGLVARYGLAQMTKNNQATDTRLLITHDSPHQGANVPVGLQGVVLNLGRANLMGYTIEKILPEYAEVKALMLAPATKQLLMYRVELHENQSVPYFNFSSYYYSTIEQNTWLSSIYRPMITFSTTDPQPTYRFIATSQGSECGNQLFAPSSQLLNVQGNAGALLLPFVGVTGTANGSIEAYALPNIGSSGQLSKIDLEARIYFLGLRIKKSFFKTVFSISNSTLLPIDGVAGGTSPIGRQSLTPSSTIGSQPLSKNGFFSLLYVGRLNTATLSNFTFVPTPSALDIQNFNLASLSSVYVGGKGSNSNPVAPQNFIAQEAFQGNSNESHTSFTARNANWLFNEMENVPNNNLNCSNNCISQYLNELQISGPASFCDSATYTISNLPNGVTPIWSIDGSGADISSANGNQVTVIAGSGIFQVKATLSTSCGSIDVLSNTISTGFPYGVQIDDIMNDGMGTANGTVCSDSPDYDNYYNTFNYSISPGTPFPVSLTYRLWGNTGLVLQNTITVNSSSGTIKLPGYEPNGGYTLDAFLTGGPCNMNSEVAETYIYYESCDIYSAFVTYPNPANTEIIVGYQQNTNSTSTQKNLLKANNSSFKVKILDDKGTQRKAELNSADGKSVTVQVADLPNGTYFIHITKDKKVTKKQIIIQH